MSNWAKMQESLGGGKKKKKPKGLGKRTGRAKESSSKKRRNHEGQGTQRHESGRPGNNIAKFSKKVKRTDDTLVERNNKQPKKKKAQIYQVRPNRPKAITRAMKRRNVRPAPMVLDSHKGLPREQRVCVPGDDHYQTLLDACYRGFVVEPPSEAPGEAEWRSAAQDGLLELARNGYFKKDIVMPDRVENQSATFVRRCVVGDPGTTYKYLGLRVFSYPWTGEHATPELVTMKALNEVMSAKTHQRLDLYHSEDKPEDRGSCEYNLTLINQCHQLLAPDGKEPPFKTADSACGRAAVSWHQDTSLEDYSSVGVFHYVPEPVDGEPWSVAVRVIYDRKTPALHVPLLSGSSYYLLDTFNHHHKHVVISGSGMRYSSTHRVAVTADATWDYVWSLVNTAQSVVSCHDTSSSRLAMASRDFSKLHDALFTIENEWIRQWYWQGVKHANNQPYWKERIEQQLEPWWKRLEEFAAVCYRDLAASKSANENVAKLKILTKAAFGKTDEMRKLWVSKMRKAEQEQLDASDVPALFIYPGGDAMLGEDLTPYINKL